MGVVGKGGGVGDNADTAPEEAVLTVVDEPRSYTDQDAARMTPDQVRAAAGLQFVKQMNLLNLVFSIEMRCFRYLALKFFLLFSSKATTRRWNAFK